MLCLSGTSDVFLIFLTVLKHLAGLKEVVEFQLTVSKPTCYI